MRTSSGYLPRALALAVMLAIVPSGTSLAREASSGPPSGPAAPAATATTRPTPPTGSVLTAEPSVVTAVLAPGESQTAKVSIRAGIPLELTLRSDGLGQEPGGGFVTLVQANDTSRYSARPFVDVAPTKIKLRANEAREVTIRIRIPKDVGEGSRYAVLDVQGRPIGGDGNVGIGMALGVSVIVTVKDTIQTRVGAIEGLALERTPLGSPLAVSGLLRNMGNSHFGAAPNAVYAAGLLTNANAEAVADARVTFDGNSIVPTFARAIRLEFGDGTPLPNGRYRVALEAGLADGTLLDRYLLDFTIQAGGVLGETVIPDRPLPPPAGGESGADDLNLLFAIFAAALVAVLLATRARRRAAGPRPAPTEGPS